MNQINNYTDVLISGGGFVGLAQALAFAKAGLTVRLLEKSESNGKQADHRGIALANTSKNFLNNIGAWQFITEKDYSFIKSIHVSAQKHFGSCLLSAKEIGWDTLGYVVNAKALLKALEDAANKQKDKISIIRPMQVESFTEDNGSLTVLAANKDNKITFKTGLLIGAEGINSPLREMLGIASKQHSYDKNAIVAKVKVSAFVDAIAYERFTKNGPIAFLPHADNQYGLVWSLPKEGIKELLEASEDVFLRKLQQEFGFRLGKLLKVSNRQSYPLVQMLVDKPYKGRALLLGSAWHHFHPAAGQGLNLSFRDIAELTTSIVEMQNQNAAVEKMLAKFVEDRQSDQNIVIKGTSILVDLFETNYVGFNQLRGLALSVLDNCYSLKNELIQMASGHNGQLSTWLIG